mmetsp:Transcript_76469/g.219099  ORF Transcript_76469/g.219099 Transcript_76469/m.219099 type:complete len:263 (+) Transcript_76469:1265-2053(+)
MRFLVDAAICDDDDLGEAASDLIIKITITNISIKSLRSLCDRLQDAMAVDHLKRIDEVMSYDPHDAYADVKIACMEQFRPGPGEALLVGYQGFIKINIKFKFNTLTHYSQNASELTNLILRAIEISHQLTNPPTRHRATTLKYRWIEKTGHKKWVMSVQEKVWDLSWAALIRHPKRYEPARKKILQYLTMQFRQVRRKVSQESMDALLLSVNNGNPGASNDGSNADLAQDDLVSDAATSAAQLIYDYTHRFAHAQQMPWPLP